MNAPAAFDATTLEVLWTRLRSVTDEAAKVIVRTSFSTLSIEANDYSCVLTDAAGNSLAQNTASIPSFIATLPATTRHMIAALGRDTMREGEQPIHIGWIGRFGERREDEQIIDGGEAVEDRPQRLGRWIVARKHSLERSVGMDPAHAGQ